MSDRIQLRQYSDREKALCTFDKLAEINYSPQMSILVGSKQFYVSCWVEQGDLTQLNLDGEKVDDIFFVGRRLSRVAVEGFEAIEQRAKRGYCGLCHHDTFTHNPDDLRCCARCGAENLIEYCCPGCQSSSGVGDKMGGCAFCGQPLIP